MPKLCKICQSSKRAEYEKWLLDGKMSLRECSAESQSLYSEVIPFVAFHRHKKHMTEFIEKAITAEEKSKLRKAKVFQEAYDSAARLKENIEVLSEMLSQELKAGRVNLREMNAIKGLLGEIRLTAIALDSMQEKYFKAETSEEEIMTFIEEIERKDPAMASKLLEIYLGVDKGGEEKKPVSRQAQIPSV